MHIKITATDDASEKCVLLDTKEGIVFCKGLLHMSRYNEIKIFVDDQLVHANDKRLDERQ